MKRDKIKLLIKISEVLLTGIIALSVSIPAMADENGHKYIIRNNPKLCNYSMEGHSYKAYRIFDFSWNGKKYDLKVNDNYLDFFKDLPGAPEKEGELLDNFIRKYMLNTPTQEVADALGSYTTQRCIGENAATESNFKVTKGVESLTIPNIEEGCYLVLDENGLVPRDEGNYGNFSIINVSFSHPIDATTTSPYTQTYNIENYVQDSDLKNQEPSEEDEEKEENENQQGNGNQQNNGSQQNNGNQQNNGSQQNNGNQQNNRSQQSNGNQQTNEGQQIYAGKQGKGDQEYFEGEQVYEGKGVKIVKEIRKGKGTQVILSQVINGVPITNGDTTAKNKAKESKPPHTYYVYKLYDITWDDKGWHSSLNNDFINFYKGLEGAPKDEDSLCSFAASYAFKNDKDMYHQRLRDYILSENIDPVTISQVGVINPDNREYVQISNLGEGNYLVLDKRDCRKGSKDALTGRHEYISIVGKKNPNK